MVENELSVRERVLMVLRGETPRHLPFVTRLETWFTAHQRSHTLPKKFHHMTLDEVHQAVGVGRLKFTVPYKYRLKGVEVHTTFNGEDLTHQTDPVVENFPGLWDLVPTDRAGTTHRCRAASGLHAATPCPSAVRSRATVGLASSGCLRAAARCLPADRLRAAVCAASTKRDHCSSRARRAA